MVEPSFHRAIVVAILLQRLIPVDSGSDLFIYKAPETPVNKVYTIRPYLAEDELPVYSVCRKTCLDGSDGTEMFSEYPNLAPERYVLVVARVRRRSNVIFVFLGWRRTRGEKCGVESRNS